MRKRKPYIVKKRVGLIGQVYALIVVIVILMGVLTYNSQYRLSIRTNKSGITDYVCEVAGETIDAVKEFPAYNWLLKYWHDHASELDIEYEENFRKGSATNEKEALLRQHQPGLFMHYATEEELEALPPEDQKLYAEIAYSWLITRIDEIKKNYNADFLYAVVTDSDLGENPYGEQFFLFSGADPGSVRGMEYNQIYPLGKVMSTKDDPDVQNAMREAVEKARNKASFEENPFGRDESGNYIDEYAFLGWAGDQPALVGISFNMKKIYKDVSDSAMGGTIHSMLYQFLMLQIIMFHLFFFFIRPLKKVATNIRSYTEDKDSARVKENLDKALSKPILSHLVKNNEIGQLKDDFIELTEELDDHVERIEMITAERKRVEVELDVASRIQQQMLPDSDPVFAGHGEIELSAFMEPAKEVGGDFYDYFLVDDDHLALVVADVSSKGVPASLFMVIAKTLIKDRALMGESPEELLCNVNNELVKKNDTEYFVTVWIAIVELSTGKGIAANAGHEHPVICRNGGEFELVVYKHSPGVGVMEDIPFRQHEFYLEPGDRLFVYTDGVPEATNKEDKQFGTERMLSFLNSHRGLSNRELLHTLRQDIASFEDGADQFDDITMLCFRYEKK